MRQLKGYEQKKCFYCHSSIVTKNGVRKGKQRYKCHSCNRQFVGGGKLVPAQLWQEYVGGKQTYKQLSAKYGCSIRTVQRKIDGHEQQVSPPSPRSVVVLMDTTYWGREFGVMLFKDAISGENLLKKYVKNETNALYVEGISQLRAMGFSIGAIVCDGRKGLVGSFDMPVQMCQFHQAAIIRRYLTKKPKLEPAKELLAVVDAMKQADRASFEGALQRWHAKWEKFLMERSTSPQTGKSHYSHKKLRSAYRSLNTNLPWLFTYCNYKGLDIPNTTNAIDGHFADLKNKLRNHNGLSKKRKMKFIDEFLKA